MVGLTNDLLEAKMELGQEENILFLEMCRLISQYQVEIEKALLAAAEIDMIRARWNLGSKLKGVIPTVRLTWTIN